MNKKRFVLLFLLSPLVFFGTVEIIKACFSSPKPLNCPRTMYLAASIDGVIVNPIGGGPVPLPVGVVPFVSWDQTAGCAVPVGASGKVDADVTITTACTPVGGGSAVQVGSQSFALPVPSEPGLQPGHSVEVVVPDGLLDPAVSYVCDATATYTVSFAGGFGAGALSSTRTARAAVIEESSTLPGAPRVNARLIAPDAAQEMAKASVVNGSPVVLTAHQ